MKRNSLKRAGLAFLAMSIAFARGASAGPATGATTAYLDDGTSITVNYVDYAPVNSSLNSILATNVIENLVLAADRSTKSGCPYYAAKKGLFKTGDHIFITNNYMAWFDYTLGDGVGNTSWSRSGALAGYWSLDPSKADHANVIFRHFYDPGQTVSGNTPNNNGICWNWARNELIPGSDSPGGQAYWWDTYAPPVEHTIVFQTTSLPSDISLFSTVYAQGARGSGFVEGNTGWWDGVGGMHFTTAGLMTSSTGSTSFSAVDPANPSATVTGVINYVLDYDAQEDGIQIVWIFSSSATIVPKNLYVDLWATYAGLGAAMSAAGFPPNETCGADSPYPVPAQIFGVGSAPYHNFLYAQSSLPSQTAGIVNGTVDVTNNAAATIVPFPWAQTSPCNPQNFNAGVVSTPIPTGIPLSATISAGYSSTLSSTLPLLHLTNMINPQQQTCNWTKTPTASQAALNPTSGDCPQSAPASFPLTAMLLNYEHSDQQQGLLLSSQNSGHELIGGQWYIVSYLFGSE
jgi:hypothetical protein